MEISFKSKRALVTGASRGIGRGIAVALAKAGAEVVALARSKDELQALCAEQSGITALVCDLADRDHTRQAVQDVLPIHLLVNNAGLGSLQSFLETDLEQFDKVFDVNVKAAVALSQLVAGDLIDRKLPGVIVNVSSQASMMTLTDHTAYCASKAALDAITRSMALELGPNSIRVNSVNPTVVLTDLGRRAWSDEQRAAPMLQRIPLGRFAEVHEVVDAVVFLASDRASMIHGVCLPVDGGALISGP